MITFFFASVLAGIILGAPIGVAGALVADAAFAHAKRRLESVILAAVAGDTLLAVLSSFFIHPLNQILETYHRTGQLIAGIAIIVMATYIASITFINHKGLFDKSEIPIPFKWLLGHAAPALSAFLITVFHPGSIGAFLAITAVFSLKFPDFHKLMIFFVLGVAIGSFLIFSSAGIVFWKIRKEADRFIHYFRYGLATLLGLGGIYIIFSNL